MNYVYNITFVFLFALEQISLFSKFVLYSRSCVFLVYESCLRMT